MSKFFVISILLTSTFTVLAPKVAAAADLRYTAKVYDIGDKSKSNLLYNYRSESEYVGDTAVVHNRFTYPDGREASHEDITFQKDKSVSLYKQHQEQLGADGSIVIGGGKATFTWKKDGKEKSATEDAGTDFIVGSQIPIQLADNWEKVMKGETLYRRLAVLERLETIGFNFSKEGETDIDGKHVVKIKMKPSSFIIAAVVSPIRFYFTPDGSTLVQIEGRTTVKKDVGGKKKDLDALIVYTKGPASQLPKVPAAGNSK